MKCPVCAVESKNNICLNCGYDLENDLMNNKLLNRLNKEEIDKYNQQINIQKKLYQELLQLRQNKSIKIERIYTKEEKERAYQCYKKGYECFSNKDYVNAERYFIQADQLGDRLGPFYLGILYQYADSSKFMGITKDLYKAFYYYQRSAQRGFSAAYRTIGDMYFMGLGVEKNVEKGLEMYNKAIELNDNFALYELAHRYRFGRGCLEKDYKKAVEFYKKDIDKHKTIESYRNLAEMYEQGLGVPKDLNKAKELRKTYDRLRGNE